MRRLLWCALLLAPMGCGFEELDFTAKGCPCDDGFECDSVCDRCVSVNADQGKIEVSDLAAEWATPNVIRWAWSAEGSPSDLGHYELLLGTDAGDVCSGRNVQVLGPDDLPELARFVLPQAIGGDKADRTMTLDLLPDTSYFARLRAVDTSGEVSETNVAVARTALDALTGSLTIYGDDDLPGVAPPCMMSSSDAPYNPGGRHYGFDGACANSDPNCEGSTDPNQSCYGPVAFAPDAIDLTERGPGDLAAAYLELAIAIDDGAPSFWTEFSLRRFSDDANFHVDKVTLRSDGQYHLYQFKLDALVDWPDKVRAITLDDLSAPYDDVFVGGTWTLGSAVRMDEIRIKW